MASCRGFRALACGALWCALFSCDDAEAPLPPRASLLTRAAIALEVGPTRTAGLDLDGIDSDGSAPFDGSGCAHTDVVGTLGEPGVDAQLTRGVSRSHFIV